MSGGFGSGRSADWTPNVSKWSSSNYAMALFARRKTPWTDHVPSEPAFLLSRAERLEMIFAAASQDAGECSTWMILAREDAKRKRSTPKKGSRHVEQFPQFCSSGKRVRARLSRVPHSRRLRALSSRRDARGHEAARILLQGGWGTSPRLDGGRGNTSGGRARRTIAGDYRSSARDAAVGTRSVAGACQSDVICTSGTSSGSGMSSPSSSARSTPVRQTSPSSTISLIGVSA